MRTELTQENLDYWISQYETIRQEREESFDRLSKAVGGVGLTPSQPEVDMIIECRIDQLHADIKEARKEAEKWRSEASVGHSSFPWEDRRDG